MLGSEPQMRPSPHWPGWRAKWPTGGAATSQVASKECLTFADEGTWPPFYTRDVSSEDPWTSKVLLGEWSRPIDLCLQVKESLVSTGHLKKKKPKKHGQTKNKHGQKKKALLFIGEFSCNFWVPFKVLQGFVKGTNTLIVGQASMIYWICPPPPNLLTLGKT